LIGLGYLTKYISPQLQTSGKSSEKVLKILKNFPALSAREVADRLELNPRAVEKQIAKLREKGLLRRVGPAKGGHWEVLQ
jgi:ATP-dependent DNA helicase RecG